MSKGFSGIPITKDGTIGSKLMGIVTSRDIDFIKDTSTLLAKVMTTKLITAKKGISLNQANQILKESKLGKLLIIDEEGNLCSLLSRADLIKSRDYPQASKRQDKLLCGAAVSTHTDDRERIKGLCEAGVDLIVLDSSQGNSSYQVDAIQWIKSNYPQIDVCAGNAVTVKQAKSLIDAGGID